MKILKAKVNWLYGYSNDPELQILVNKIPNSEDFRWKEISKGLYYSEREGFSKKFAYSKPGEGFGGRHFKIRMESGEEKILIGPWSSRAACCTKAGYPSVDLAITEDSLSFERGYTFYSGMVTLEKAKEAVALINGVELLKINRRGEIIWVPYLLNNSCVGHWPLPTDRSRRCDWCGHLQYPDSVLEKGEDKNLEVFSDLSGEQMAILS